jgi:PKD repeat protein
LSSIGVRDSLYERNVQQSGGGSNNTEPYYADHRNLILMQRNQKLINVQFSRTEVNKAIVLLKRFYQRPFLGVDTSFNRRGWGSANYPNNIIIDYNEPGDAIILDDSSILVLPKYGSNSNSFVCKFKTSQYSYQPQAPVARIGLSQVYGIVGVSKIQLFDSSLYYPSNRTWTITPGNYQFQNGTSITSQNPKIIFTHTGKYDIKLVVWNAVGKDSTIINQAIDIGNNPVANFGATTLVSDTTMILGLIDSSLYNPAYRKWTISAPNFVFVNSSDTSANPNVRFTQSGFYTVKLWVRSVYGVDSITKQNYFTVVNTSSPVANFESDKQQVRQDSIVRFFDKSIFTPQSRRWVFSPPNAQYLQGTDSASVNPVMKFNAVGNYTVKLIVSNSQGIDSLIKNNYIQVGLPPQANFGVSQTQGTPGTEVEIVDSSLYQVASREWLITPNTYTVTQGNLASTTLRLKFDSIGLYTIKLKVTNYYGVDSLIKNNLVDIGLKPQASFGVSQTQGTPGTEVDIVDSSLNQVTGREWEIVPNTFAYVIGNSNASSIRVRFDSAGSYSIKLRVQNQYGADSMLKNNSIIIIPVGLSEQVFNHSDITIFPNPAAGKFMVTWNKLYLQEIMVIDRIGGFVKCVTPDINAEFVSVNVSDLADGIYMVILKTEDGFVCRKITISTR